tara:strand:- start:650 stop:1066 length:417 start_codon:yes stop_codon:yes gene_type:complete
MFQKILGLLLCFSLLIGVKMLIRYQRAESDVAESANASWPKNFKDNFKKSCEEEFKSSIKQRRTPTQKQEKKIDVISQNYCQCITNDIESRKIIPTKFNPMKENEKQFAKRVIAPAITNYIQSKKGKKTIKICMDKAI